MFNNFGHHKRFDIQRVTDSRFFVNNDSGLITWSAHLIHNKGQDTIVITAKNIKRFYYVMHILEFNPSSGYMIDDMRKYKNPSDLISHLFQDLMDVKA